MDVLTDQSLVLSDREFQRISDAIYDHCGINLHAGKRGLVQSRLSKLVRRQGFETFTKYIDYILSDEGKEEFVTAVDTLSTNLTFFFRENQHFEYLRQDYLPKLIANKSKEANKRVRVWSAACSSGEEPYSLAITLAETFAQEINWDIKILATDISTRVLERAKMGTYDIERIEPLTAQQKQRFLVANNIEGRKVFQVRRELTDMVRFRHLNLMDAWPFRGRFDIIFVRNVMIYFDKPTQAVLVKRFWDHLADGGLLCIGHSESLTGIDHSFRYVQPATYQKA
ncbi:MAG: protein-glutamate O-methyltransferase [Sedimentisphaerales bacterium]|nr:protein-glutamate O-methyltransferase [Sedimentisphaerales bacterium]